MNFNDGAINYVNDHQGYWLKPAPPIQRIPGRWQKIYWIGLGSKTNGLHTKKEFMNIMRKQYPDHLYFRRIGDRAIPEGKIKKDDIQGWMDFANARYI